MQEALRKEVETMIEAAIGGYHGENLERFAGITKILNEILTRIIGIDGNGTGREGVLQRQNRDIETMIGKVNILETRSKYWNKADAIKAFKWFCMFLVALAGVFVAYMEYHAKTHPTEPLIGSRPIAAVHAADQ